MSNRNRRAKQLEKQLRKSINTQIELQKDMQEHDTDLLEIQEENSQLRQMIDEQNDYIKHGFKEIKESLLEQHQNQECLSCGLEVEKKLRRHRDNQLREEIAAVGMRIRLATHTWLGKFIFK